MQKYWNNVTNRTGDVVPGASVTVKVAATGALATIYSDNGVTAKANPMTADNNGYFSFYAADGLYTLTITGSGIQTLTISDVLIEDLSDLTGGEGASLVGYLPAGTGAVARTVQAALDEVVSVKRFGAVGDGATDDTEAFRKAAARANAIGATLRVDPGGTYYFNSPADIPLRVSMDARGAVFKLGAGLGATEVFEVLGQDLQDITASVTLAEIVKGRFRVPSLAGYINGFVKIVSDIPNVKRYTSDASAVAKSEAGYVTKNGDLISPIRHDYSTGGTITNVYFRKDDPQQLTIIGGAVDVNGLDSARFMMIQRNAVKVTNWSVYDSTNSADLDFVLLFRAFNCANPVFEDFNGDAMKHGGNYSYLFDLNHVVNANFSRCFVHAGWGAWKADSVNGYHIRDSHFDRFDIHYDGYDVSVDGCVFYQSVQFGCGGGFLKVNNCSKIVKNTSASSTAYFLNIVQTRGDYGGFWDGEVHISNITVQVDPQVSGYSSTNPLTAFKREASGDFGTGRSVPDPHTITVRDIVINASDTLLAASSFGFVAIQLYSGITNGGSGGTIPPQWLVVDHVVFNKLPTSAFLSGLSERSDYTTAIASGYSSPKLLTVRGVGGNVRGIGAVDNQITRTTTTRVASGDYSAIAGGDSNTASGARSWVPGGSQATTRARDGSWAAGSNTEDNQGRYQSAGIFLQTRTTSTTATRLVAGAPSAAASASNQLSMPSNAGVAFEALVIARAPVGNIVKAWKLSGVMRNSGGSASLVGSLTKTVIAEYAGSTAWDVAATVDNTLDCLAITATGDASLTVDWHAKVDAVEIA